MGDLEAQIIIGQTTWGLGIVGWRVGNQDRGI